MSPNEYEEVLSKLQTKMDQLEDKYDTLLMDLAESKLNIVQLQYNNKLLIESLEFYAEAKRDVLDWDRGNEARYTLKKLGLWKP